jgi:CDP-diacylglycerol--serine O-phosphatidyltransferase
MTHRAVAVPQLLTAVRVILGAYALMAALDGRLYAAATLVTLGAVTDGLDGFAARRLDAASSFGALFDYFADYICYVIAPWAIARSVLGRADMWIDAALAIPLLTSAIRYARNGLIVADTSQTNIELPGLGTVYFAFLTVVAVFLDAKHALGEPTFSRAFVALIIAFSLLMIAPFRNPKLTAFGHVPAIVLILVAIMPFAATKVLAAAMFLIGLLYPIIARIYARPSQIR